MELTMTPGGGGRGGTFGDGFFWTDGVTDDGSGVDGVSGGRGVDGVSVISITWSISYNDRLLTGNSSNLSIGGVSKFRIRPCYIQRDCTGAVVGPSLIFPVISTPVVSPTSDHVDYQTVYTFWLYS